MAMLSQSAEALGIGQAAGDVVSYLLLTGLCAVTLIGVLRARSLR